MPPHAPTSGGSSEYGTPRHLFDYLNRRFRFDYDPFAALDNRMPVRRFSTRAGTYDATSREVSAVSELDGFDQPWTGRRVFFNPPYKPNGTIGRAVDKAVLERHAAEIIVAILPVDTSVKWWHTLKRHAHLEELLGRPGFIDHATGLPKDSSTVPIVVAIFQPDADAWARHAPPRQPRAKGAGDA